MDMHPVQSSHMRAVGYEPTSRTMHIQFHNGEVHEYTGVPQPFHDTMMSAESVGSFFHKNVKPFFNSRRIK